MSEEPERSPDDESRPLEARLPPEIHATPADLRTRPDEPLRWWRPGWHEVVGHVGYRWIFLLPAVVLVLLLVAAFFIPGLGPALLVVGFKLLVFAGAVAL